MSEAPVGRLKLVDPQSELCTRLLRALGIPESQAVTRLAIVIDQVAYVKVDLTLLLDESQADRVVHVFASGQYLLATPDLVKPVDWSTP